MRRIPKYRRVKKVYARVTIDGRDVYLGRYGTEESRAEYDRVIAEWLATGTAPPTQAEADTFTVEQLIDAFYTYAQQHYGTDNRNSTAFKFRPVLRALRRLYGDLPADQFSPKCLLAMQEEFVKLGHNVTYVNMQTTRIKQVFKWAVSRELVSGDTHYRLTAVPGLTRGRSQAKQPRQVKLVPEEDVEATLKHLSPVLQAMVLIQRLTGCRPGEVTRMRPCDIDRTGDVWVYAPPSHKTARFGKDRRICLGPETQRILSPFLLRDAAAPLFLAHRIRASTTGRTARST